MQLAHIDFDHLCISALNMRHGRKAPDVSDILPSIRARGVLVPLLVRPNGTPDTYEVVAGRRRYFSVKAVKEAGGEVPPLPLRPPGGGRRCGGPRSLVDREHRPARPR